MTRFALSVSLAVALLLFAPASFAARYTVGLSGSNENPQNASPAVGSGIVDIDPASHQLSINIVFNGLTGNTTLAHIHCCIAPPGNAGVATPVPAFPGFPLGVTSGTYNITLDMTQASSWNAAFLNANGGTPAGAEAALVAGAAAGQAYLNIHTTTFGGGEIRGFLTAQVTRDVPTLSEWALVGIGGLLTLAAFVTLRRRMN